MQPIELLTDNDKELITQYSMSYASTEPSSIEEVLSAWNKNKKKLFRIFGKQLRISAPIEIETDSRNFKQKFRSLYTPLMMFDEFDIQRFQPDPRNHQFMNSLGCWLRDTYTEELYPYYKKIIDLTKYCHCESGKVMAEYHLNLGKNNKELFIPRGTKLMRAMRKALEYYSFPRMEDFEKWRDDLSIISTDKKINSELVFSIHPIDFMTMSDNRCGWTSCMSWISHGGYSTGTIEMMNSDVAIVAYLKSKTDFQFNDFDIPNKSWRSLIFIHKDILLVGKHYPYQSETLAKVCLRELQQIIKNNVGWTYQYKEQLYLDMIHSYNNCYVKADLGRNHPGHKIFTYMNIMYHDMLEDHDTQYWCCRNYVKKNLYLNLSGKATCMCCGKPIDKDGYNDISASAKFCDDCFRDYGCSDCNQISKAERKYKVKIEHRYGKTAMMKCANCLMNYYMYDNIGNAFVKKTELKKWKNSMDFPQNTVSQFRPVTMEVIERNEVCCAL